MMDAAMRERVWARWLTEYPEDADLDERGRDMVLGTYRAESMAFRLACEDVDWPFRKMAIGLADDLDARFDALRREGLLAALRHTR